VDGFEISVAELTIECCDRRLSGRVHNYNDFCIANLDHTAGVWGDVAVLPGDDSEKMRRTGAF